MSKKITSNLIWRFLERFGAEGVSTIVTIVLARLLEPSVYGTIALVTVFTSLLQNFVDTGFSSALIQKKDADDVDFSSIFWFNVATAIVLYTGMFFAAPLIARFYDMPELTAVVRVMSLILFVSAFKNVQHAYVSRNMIFKKFFYATLTGTITAAVVGVWMAYKGFGVWALVAQNLVNQAIDTVCLWLIVDWRPIFVFNWKRFKGLFNYGYKLLLSGLIDTAYSKLRTLVIGKVYTSDDLAFYNKGDLFPSTVVGNINSAVLSVLFPAFSSKQDNPETVKAMAKRGIKTATYLIMPMTAGLAACAAPLVSIVLTDKWLPSVFFMRIACFSYSFYVIHSINLNVMKGMGRSDYFLKLEIIKKVMGIAVVFATMFISVKAMALSTIFTSVASQIINSWPNRKLISYNYLEQLKDMLPSIALSGAMGLIVYCVSFLGLGNWATLLIQVPLGVALYLGGSVLFKMESFTYLWTTMAKPMLSKLRKQ